MAERLKRLEAMMSTVLEENRRLDQKNQNLERRYEDLRRQVEQGSATDETPQPTTDRVGDDFGIDDGTADPSHEPNLPSPPAPSLPGLVDPLANWAVSPALPVRPAATPRYFNGYDNGFILAEDANGVSPFKLKLNIWNQFRYVNFIRAVDSWTDNAGITRPINNRSDFEIVRGRLIFSGYAFDPRYQYRVNLDYNTVASDQITLLDAWVNYKFNDYFNLHFGKEKNWASREWIESAAHTLGADRTLATTYFRPSRTAGVWSTGNINPRLKYRALIGNGFNTSSLRFDQLDANFAYSGDIVWEPLGPFGRSFSDLEWHDDPVIRLGTNGVTAKQTGSQADSGDPEQTQIRLSDGTLFTEQGALAPDVTVNNYHITFWGLDAGLKYRGWSLSGEYFFRWLSDIEGNGPLPVRNLFDHGFYGQLGYFAIPERMELYARTSQVYGGFGNGFEYSGGMNWFFQGRDGWRFTFDATRVFHSPTQQVRTDYQAGASGLILRAQIWTVF